MPEFTIQQHFAGKHRAFTAYPEPGWVDAAGTAYTTATFHVPVQAEFSALFKTLLTEAEEYCGHHLLRPAYTYLRIQVK